MRSASFVALRELMVLVQRYPRGLRAQEMLDLVRRDQLLRTRRGQIASRTTVFHYRNILLHLGVLVRDGQQYLPNQADPAVSELLISLRPGEPTLGDIERRLFARLVVQEETCRRRFFDLFMSRCEQYGLEELLRFGGRVSWRRERGATGPRVVLRGLETSQAEESLSSVDEVQAILYGVRHWARNELRIIDEVFMEDVGGVMYPVAPEGTVSDDIIVCAVLERVEAGKDWSILSVRDTAYECGARLRVPVTRIFRVLQGLKRAHPEHVVFIPTAQAFATITTASRFAEAYQLRGYLQDGCGHYISHLRIHRSVKEALR